MSKKESPYVAVKAKIDKLMANPDKPIEIPERKGNDRSFPDAPEFVRNIMGSSAGAGSGEFHVYRHLRRKEYARQRFLTEQARKEELDAEFEAKVEARRREEEERTAKKRAKRLKKKQKQKRAKMEKKSRQSDANEESSEEDGDVSDNTCLGNDGNVDGQETPISNISESHNV